MFPLQFSVPVDVIIERVRESRSTDDGSVTIANPKQKYDSFSNRGNSISVRYLRYTRFYVDYAFELRIGGESSAMDGSTINTINVKLNLALTDTETWLERGVEVCLDRTS